MHRVTKVSKLTVHEEVEFFNYFISTQLSILGGKRREEGEGEEKARGGSTIVRAVHSRRSCSLPYYSCILPTCHNICDGHRLTGSLAAQSSSHRQFLDGHKL